MSYMKLRKRIGAWVLAGAMMATVGAQALAYQTMGNGVDI